MRNYRKYVAWSDEDQAWIATSPDFPGLSAAADSDVDALAQLRDVLEGAIATYQEEGWPLPEPQPLQTEYSGQLRLRLPRSLHAAAVQRAEEEGISLNSLLQCFVAQGLGEARALSAAAAEIRQLLGDVRACTIPQLELLAATTARVATQPSHPTLDATYEFGGRRTAVH